MLRRKISVLFLACMLFVCLCGVTGTARAEEDVVYNGGFEILNAQNKPDGWWMGNTVMGTDFFWEETRPYAGERALRVLYQNKSLLFQAQGTQSLTPGTSVTVSAMIKMLSTSVSGFTIESDYTDSAGIAIADEPEKYTIGGLWQGRWIQKSFTFQIPENADTCIFRFRLQGSGEFLIDEVKETGVRRLSVEDVLRDRVDAQTFEYLPPMAGEEELLQNGGFEALDAAGHPVGWVSYKDWTAGNAPETENVYSGSGAVKLNGGTNPWVSQSFPYREGYTYQLSALVKIDGTVKGRGFGFKIELYDADGNHISAVQKNLGYVQSTNGAYKRIAYSYTPAQGAGAATMAVYFRMYGTGTLYVDDASCYIVDDESLSFLTDDVFYYSDRTEDGKAVVSVSETEDYTNMRADFAFTDGKTGNTLLTETNVPFTEDMYMDGHNILPNADVGYQAKCAVFTYPMALFAEKTREYRVSCTVHDGNGNTLKSFVQKVARYDRPAKLTREGYFVKDGKPFVPVWGYHTEIEDYPVQHEIGINTVMPSYWYFNASYPERLDAILAAAEEYDFMIIASLYPDMAPAGSVLNYENTMKIVTRLKDEPRILAYNVQDEPSLQFSAEEDLWWSYRLIHSIDPDTPIYMVDCTENMLARTLRYTDIALVDPYPGGEIEAQVTDFPAAFTLLAQETVGYDRPVYTVIQTYADKRTPDIQDVRSNYYQALFRGAGAVGYFSISDAYTRTDAQAPNLYGSPLWEDLKTFAAWEQKEATHAFILCDRTVLDEELREDVWYRVWQGEDGSFYALLLSKSDTNTAEVEIPLESFDGSIQIGAYTAELIAGGDRVTKSGSGTLSHTLLPIQTALYKIVPKNPVDMSGISNTRFKDLGAYRWARAAIETLDKSKILNDNSPTSFAPGREITRAEFAYGLIRALALTGEGTESFADVKAHAFYAGELAIGKEMGILKGVGDNSFAPDAAISRQDMLVIMARGMRLKKGLAEGDAADLAAFSDTTAIADYAALDIAAMVRANIVLGNADGTLNPAGNTTRAEAACLLDRVMKWNTGL